MKAPSILLLAAALFQATGQSIAKEEIIDAWRTIDVLTALEVAEATRATEATKATKPTNAEGPANKVKINIKATTLRCYTCDQETSNDKCQTISNCTVPNKICQTTVATSSSGTITSKNCASSCVPTNDEINGISFSISCCTTDLCNTNQAPCMKSSHLSLGISACFIAAFFWFSF
ncbi:hypothetical protein NDU88_003941 [Pleurodeles waltl]|uniref:UPAR/Ly6 domain-containing protein n=1 Tax=Pleurodeles waltl TaxID=8319 RepID=A0AAV7V0G1_PLEWA|nr:hypothetical protein NDU88_003941 [Pleurodeles waltl]